MGVPQELFQASRTGERKEQNQITAAGVINPEVR